VSCPRSGRRVRCKATTERALDRRKQGAVLVVMRRQTAIWAAVIVATIAAGVVVGVVTGSGPLRPRHFGVYVAVGAVAAGLIFGLRGAAVPAFGIASFGIVRLVQHATHPSSGEHEAGIIVGLYCFYFPLMFAVLSAFGAGLRRLCSGVYRLLSAL
jgi:hypothetical protein